MFYKQFLKVIEIDPAVIEKFDYWLATLPIPDQQNITATSVAAILDVDYSTGAKLLEIAFSEKILERNYIVLCPKCDYSLGRYSSEELKDMLSLPMCCDECEEPFILTTDEVYLAYKVIMPPEISPDELSDAINKHLGVAGTEKLNFSKADSLNLAENLYDFLYSPSEPAYTEFSRLRDLLDLDYGKNTTAKGKALENLAQAFFKEIKYVSVSSDVKTGTNQFDCSAICGIISNPTLSVLSYLSPYFIIEAKNEQKKPDNTYFNKLLAIMDTNEAQVGIIIGRKKATKPCKTIAREHYLKHAGGSKHQILVSFSDEDLEMIIDNRINLLRYLEYKIFQITSNDFDVSFYSFIN